MSRYVGIAGITTPAESRTVVKSWTRVAYKHDVLDVLLVLGILASEKTMAGGERNARSPDPRGIPSIIAGAFGSIDSGIAVDCYLHYFTKNADTLATQLAAAMDTAGEFCNGVQVNVAWPDRWRLAEFTGRHPLARVILQVGPQALALTKLPHTTSLIYALASYAWSITDILLDASGGTGKGLDIAWTGDTARAIHDAFPRLGIGIAGGISADTLPALAPLLRACPWLSIDIESGVRDENDALDMRRVDALFDVAADIFGEIEVPS